MTSREKYQANLGACMHACAVIHRCCEVVSVDCTNVCANHTPATLGVGAIPISVAIQVFSALNDEFLLE